MHIDTTSPEYAYAVGFLQADGHLAGQNGRGRLSVEVSCRDRDILEKLQKLFPCYSSIHERERATNFVDNYRSCVWTLCDEGTREALFAAGIPAGKKSAHIRPPVGAYATVDYWRGMIDGDGALGLTGRGFPFLTLVTASEQVAEAYLGFLADVTGKQKTASRNTRDHIYNIAIFKEDAQAAVAAMYYDGCLCLDRKLADAHRLATWQRPAEMKKSARRKRWSADEDEIVLAYDLREAAKILGRSEQSVFLRAWRLHGGKQDDSVTHRSYPKGRAQKSWSPDQDAIVLTRSVSEAARILARTEQAIYARRRRLSACLDETMAVVKG